jgi:acetyl-CoA carboxylase biotin carboxylase subunit
MAIRRIFIANRGEIAVRIIRAAKELGSATAQAVSAADRDMLAARLADIVVPVGPAHAAKSYLNKDAMLKAAIDSGCDAVHPGYGFSVRERRLRRNGRESGSGLHRAEA